jgi:hypothetical protein
VGYVPADAKWWLADLIVEFTFEGEVGNLVHYNLTLVRADSAEEAYSKSLRLGVEHESTYTNSDGKLVTVRFRGLRDPYVIYDELEDGAELLYEEQTNVPEQQLLSTIKSKDALSVFEPWVPPDMP